ncbi:MAG: glutamate--tRNA ligase [Planctomycetota bacterium]
MSQIVTRYAPSPTGEQHVGGARTALFNWLLARNTGGKFYLRIEDTDQARSTQSSVESLLRDLKWIGYDWDNADDLMYQSKRVPIYDKLISELMERGLAYEAWETKAELDNMRGQAAIAKRPFLYKRQNYTHEQLAKFKDEGRKPVVRFAMAEKPYYFDDEVLGPKCGVDADQAQDFVIRKTDGMPTYHFAVVIDDAEMGITHILRGAEHLLNTCQHIALQEALGYDRPKYAHLPVIEKMGGGKMSKRDQDKLIRERAREWRDAHGEIVVDGVDVEKFLSDKKSQLETAEQDKVMAVIGMERRELPEINIADFRAAGYLPETLNNFLALLGWSTGDDTERMSMDELVSRFSLDRIGKSSAKFDRAKLTKFSTEAFEHAEPQRVFGAMTDWLSVNPDSPLHRCDDDQLRTLLAMNTGFHVLAEVEQKSTLFFEAPTEYDEKAVAKFIRKGEPSGLEHLRTSREVLAAVETWDTATIEAAIRKQCEGSGAGLGKVAQPLRIAVAGGPVSPPIFDTLAFLGKDKTLTRIDATLAALSETA